MRSATPNNKGTDIFSELADPLLEGDTDSDITPCGASVWSDNDYVCHSTTSGAQSVAKESICRGSVVAIQCELPWGPRRGDWSPEVAEEDAVEFSKRATTFQTSMAILKSFIGSGILVIPQAFMDGGLGFSLCEFGVIFAVALYSMLLLLEASDVSGKDTYGGVASHCFNRFGGVLINASVMLSQLGFCCVYAIFVATTLQRVFLAFDDTYVSLGWLIWAQFIVYVPLVWVRRLRYLSPFVIAADSFIGFGLLVIAVSSIIVVTQRGPRTDELQIFNQSRWMYSIGTFVYAWEGIALVLPIRTSMQDSLRPQFPKVLCITLTGMFTSIIIFATAGVLAFGKAVQPLIITNVSIYYGKAALVTQVLYAIAIVFTYPLQFFPAAKAVEAISFDKLQNAEQRKWVKNISRAVMVCSTLTCSYIGRNKIERCVSFIGAVCCLPLALIFPSLLHLKLVAVPNRDTASMVIDTSLMTFGLVLLVIAGAQNLGLMV